MKSFITTLLCLLPSLFLQAQQLPCDYVYFATTQDEVPQDRPQLQRPTQDEIESRKIAFLSTTIALTPAEAARFWPVYNEWNKKMNDNMRARHAALRKIRQLVREKNMDEKIYAQQSQILLDGAEEEANLLAGAYQAYVAILGEIRTAKLFLAEEQFRETLIRELRQNIQKP